MYGYQPASVSAPTAATAAVTAATTAAAAVTAATTAAAATSTAAFFRPGLVHRQGAPLDDLTVHPGDGRLGFLVGAHFDEPEALRPTGVAVGDDLGRDDRPERGEKLIELGVADPPAQVADV